MIQWFEFSHDSSERFLWNSWWTWWKANRRISRQAGKHFYMAKMSEVSVLLLLWSTPPPMCYFSMHIFYHIYWDCFCSVAYFCFTSHDPTSTHFFRLFFSFCFCQITPTPHCLGVVRELNWQENILKENNTLLKNQLTAYFCFINSVCGKSDSLLCILAFLRVYSPSDII